jgi:LysM repeat protein
VIRKGDNLLALAYHYDVDVQALIAVNDIDNPRALRIGQRLIIPREEGMSPDKQATPTPTPMPLQVVNLAFHRRSDGLYRDRHCARSRTGALCAALCQPAVLRLCQL